MSTEIVSKKDFASEYKYPLRYYEIDSKMVLKPSALLNFLQDAATLNAEKNGFGYSFTSERNYGWFLIKYHMEFDEYPANLDNIIVKTEARGASKLFASRDFEVWTEDKTKCLSRIISHWFLLDMNTKEILAPLKAIEHMGSVEKRENDLRFNKINMPDSFDFEREFEIRFDDIDVNNHVNNSNYIVWAFEALPYEHRLHNKLKTLDIVYKKEVAAGYNVISKAKYDKETDMTYHLLTNKQTGDDLCMVCAKWIKE